MATAETTDPAKRPTGRPGNGARPVVGGRPAVGGRTPIGLDSVLRLGAGRVRLWALGLFAMGVVPIISAPLNHWQDWGAIWAAGATAGGPDLVDAGRHVAWQAAHGVSQAFFAYPPAAAWLFWPFARLPVDVSFWLQAALMVACIAGAGLVAARVYGLTPGVAVLAALAWAPSTASVVTGQNAPFALLVAMVAIWALATDRPWIAGLAVAVLWYKPTLALGLVALFLISGASWPLPSPAGEWRFFSPWPPPAGIGAGLGRGWTVRARGCQPTPRRTRTRRSACPGSWGGCPFRGSCRLSGEWPWPWPRFRGSGGPG